MDVALPTPLTLAYAGAYQDYATGAYPLGNGYRFYLPGLMRLNAPDDWSPFGAGGINAYAYCAGDPINRVDPSGHFHLSGQALAGIGLGALGIGLTAASLIFAPITGGGSTAAALAIDSGMTAIASGVASGFGSPGAQKAASILGWISFGTGLASAVAGAETGMLRRPSTPVAGEHAAGTLATNAPTRAATEFLLFEQEVAVGLPEQMHADGVSWVHGSNSASLEGVARFRALLSRDKIDGSPWFFRNGTHLPSGENSTTIWGLSNGSPVCRGISVFAYRDAYAAVDPYSLYENTEHVYPVLYGLDEATELYRGVEMDEHEVTKESVTIDRIRRVYVPAGRADEARRTLLQFGHEALSLRVRESALFEGYD